MSQRGERALALLNVVVMRIIEGPVPPGGSHIGLRLLFLTGLLNIPSLIFGLVFLVLRSW